MGTPLKFIVRAKSQIGRNIIGRHIFIIIPRLLLLSERTN